jgi:hypothetical protein
MVLGSARNPNVNYVGWISTMSIAPGIYDDLPNDEYHADEAISHSDCVTLLDECPRRWVWNKMHPEPPKLEFDIGTACHAMVLEPNRELLWVLPPQITDYRTNAAKEMRDNARIQGMIPLLTHQHEAVVEMARAVNSHPLANLALSDGVAERSYFWKDKTTGLMRKCRPDFVKALNGNYTVVNFKTAASAHPREISRAAWNNHWWSSQWYTSEGMRAYDHDVPPLGYFYVVVEKEPPHFVMVYRLPERMIEMGAIWTRKAIDTFAACMSTGEFPGYGESIVEVEAPRWAEVQFDEDHVAGKYALREA